MDITVTEIVEQQFELIGHTWPQFNAIHALLTRLPAQFERNIHPSDQINNEVRPRLHRPINRQTPRRLNPSNEPGKEKPVDNAIARALGRVVAYVVACDRILGPGS
jgi:hypothetical protein